MLDSCASQGLQMSPGCTQSAKLPQVMFLIMHSLFHAPKALQLLSIIISIAALTTKIRAQPAHQQHSPAFQQGTGASLASMS